MSNDKLAEQLGKLKEACAKWEKELSVYSKWAIENDGVLSLVENQVIIAIKTEIQSIKDHIKKIEASKGTEPKNKLGITQVEVKDKLANYFAAFDKLTVVVDNVKVEVETPYFMNDGGGGAYVKVGKGSPKDIQKWLQDKINSGAIKSKNPQELRDYMKQNRIGVDCSGFVSQALNHLADKEGDMEFGSDDIFNPVGRNSTSFGPAGKEFVKIAPENVQIGDTLYFDNPKEGGVNHIRIVGDVKKDNSIIYYTIYESAGSTGPRKMEWKFDGKLQEFSGNKWVVKSNDNFYRWKSLDTQVPTGGGAGQGQVQDQQNQQNNTSAGNTVNPSATLTASVGKGGKNKKADVLLVQELLNKKGASLVVDGDCGNKTITAISAFQQKSFGWSDGTIDPGGKTWNALNSSTSTTNTNATTNSTNSTTTAPQQNSTVKPDSKTEASDETVSGLGGSGKLGNSIIKKGAYIISLPPNANGAYPLIMLFSGKNQNASFFLGRVPDVYYMKSIIIFSGPGGKFTDAQSLWQQELTIRGLSVSSISICGFSLGGQAAFKDYGHASKAVGLIDPTTNFEDLAKIDSKAIFSANGASSAWNWQAKKGDPKYLCMHARQDGIKTAIAKGGVGEDTKLAHDAYPQYFLKKYRSMLI